MTDLSGHVALVTGGNGGIGLGMAMGLAEAGADIAIWGNNPTKNEAAVARLEATGRKVHLERCDVSDEAAVEAAFAATLAAMGRVDSVFANAGTSGFTPGIWELPTEEWRRVMGVNLDGAFFTVRAGARHMVERGERGRHRDDRVDVDDPRRPEPAALRRVSKTALLGLTRAMAVGLARHGVRVNAISPGWTDTDLTAAGKTNEKFVHNTTTRTPVRRWADPDEFGARGRVPGRPVAHVPHGRHARGRRGLHDLLELGSSRARRCRRPRCGCRRRPTPARRPARGGRVRRGPSPCPGTPCRPAAARRRR